MKSIISRYKTNIAGAAAAMVIAAAAPAATSAQNFSKVYDALPDMTLDQAYSALIEFQKANPYFANTYIQLGSVCEKKMIMYDPLRETKSIDFWARNAELFYGNLKVYYTEGDVRSEFYENLHIPFSGKKITDADMWRYVEEHKQMCKNHRDTTTLIYTAIESSRLNYNQSIAIFKSICDAYLDMNEMLLRYDDGLVKKLQDLTAHMAECEKQFAEYKRLTKLYPIANYKQIYEKIPIETFRLDGLTNSDFFENRFTMWDYSSWVNNFKKTFDEHIAPLRAEVEKINKAYGDARTEFTRGGIVTTASTKPYDEYFLFRLGHYDVGSLVEVLFDYLESTREMIAMAGDSLGRDTGMDLTLESRKMRRLSRLAQQKDVAAAKRKALAAYVTEARVCRFNDFFKKQYGGLSGLKSFIADEEQYCEGIVDAMSEATASYISRAIRQQAMTTDVYSSALNAAAPAVPLWVTLEPQNVTTKYVTTKIATDGNSQIAAVAGVQKANASSWFVAGISPEKATQWLLKLTGVNQVNGISHTSEGVLVSAIRKLKPVIIKVDATGKEVGQINVDVEITDIMDRDGVSGNIVWTSGNDSKAPKMSMATDEATEATWTTELSGLAMACQVSVVGNGFVVLGITPSGELAALEVTQEGALGRLSVISSGIESVISTIRVSSDEIAALAKTTSGKHKYLSFTVGE